MRLPRASGILLHVSSLPSPQGIGNLGPCAYRFVDLLERTGQSLWQVLPVGPTGYGHSPYQSPSTFAGNPLFISLELLSDEGLIEGSTLETDAPFPDREVNFDAVLPWCRERLVSAFDRFSRTAGRKQRDEFDRFRTEQAAWLDDYVLFNALKDSHGGAAWPEWEPKFVRRNAIALKQAASQLADRMELEAFIQFQFSRQWHALKQYANDRHVRMVGDIPIFVAHDSADVWANQELFHLDAAGHSTVVAGVPPDYFSNTGQLWGNPLYRWDVLAKGGFDWWVERLAHAFGMFDLVRLDHFRGLESYWEVPADAPDARPGRWVPGPGIALFRAAESRLGPLPLIAEDLGFITPPVEALRDEVGAPGMRVLQFAFGDDDKSSDYLPHNFIHHCAVYTGTHDNDTTVGWFQRDEGESHTRTAEQIERERAQVLAYLGTDGREIAWDMIRLAWSSVADTAIVPLQDVLQLGSTARMNVPGQTGGNWQWRFVWEQLSAKIESRLRTVTQIFERTPERNSPPLEVEEPATNAEP